MASGAMARQTPTGETPAQARARAAASALNQGVTESPTHSEQAARPARTQPIQTRAPLSPDPVPTSGPSTAASPEATPPEPDGLPRGYYARADKDCNQVWPGDGELAWLSETAFTIDFGGCEPGLIQQLGPTTWHEEQRCVTELGGDGGAYSIDYELTGPGEILRTARLAVDQSVESQTWKHCDTADVPAEARFRS
ncbi:MAG TPA: hypothetical protein VF633_04180 [Brevundimonas sp.]